MLSLQRLCSRYSTMCLRLQRLSRTNMKLIIVTVAGTLVAYLLLFHIVTLRYLQRENVNDVHLKNVVVHLDFKGSPPKLTYLESLLPLLKAHNVNGLLVEYEDMFPFEGKLANLSARNCYNRKELQNFLRVSLEYGFEIIPLIQTFGHLEYALKLPEFLHLREEELYPDSLCPSRKESIELIEDMLQQIITFHKKIAPLKYLHIGCDEVFHLNTCKYCIKRNQTNLNLFLTHVHRVSKYVQYFSPHTTILVWDDMFKNIIPDENNKLIFSNMVPVCWDYQSKNILKSDHKQFFMHQWLFGRMWAASAFKGADGPTQILPNMRERYMNHLYWLNIIQKFGIGSKSNLYRFEGIILTGWSRYSHMQPPCELLPVSIPSLVLNLMLIQMFMNGKTTEHNDLYLHLKTELKANFRCRSIANSDFLTSSCFPGSDLHEFLGNYIAYKKDFAHRIGSRYDTDISKHGYEIENFKQGYIDMTRLTHLTEWCLSAQQKLANMESEMISLMSRYFDKHVVEEYVYFKLDWMKKDVGEILRILHDLSVVKTWRRRPINISIEWNGSI